ncbi:hypothetical protein LX99_04802 [Mucilaginibacter oryzae]|uniref:Uncharacterized protein n=1 Tax=Mucilaginibacter oryzae TaxID=468058 RepID=A0A316GW61_9SPHI|nr:hypothetical protein [Mucilaginibacter oryzae]PWK68278.1 hypothetical protein LX99_04802 [Mucilaginibacter oryzae]
MGKDVLGTVYETLLCSPGMNEAVKIDAKISRKTILLLSSLIENGAGQDGNMSGLLGLIPAEDREELKNFGDECLKKAGLKELSEKIKTLKN